MVADHGIFEPLEEAELCASAAGLPLEHVRGLAAFASQRGESLVSVLLARGGVDERDFLARLGPMLGLRSVSDEVGEISQEVLLQLSASLATRYQVMPITCVDGELALASCEPFEWARWDELKHVLQRPVTKVLCPRAAVLKMIKDHYGVGADTVDRLLAGRVGDGVQVLAGTATDLSDEDAANEPTVVNLVNQVLAEGIRLNATDVHLEPYDERFRIRYRIDGMLEDVSMPASLSVLKKAIVSRVKIMSGLNIAEKRLPQDGRARVSMAGQDFDLRVSVLPGIHGEAVVMRIQSRQAIQLDLQSLGFEAREREAIDSLVRRPYGLFLVTGPTGSGKTTTLYACLGMIQSLQAKIITVEDPVEYWMDNVLQMQVNDAIGFTFARALRSILRHDPDILLVGEIRDRETADMAVRSALTGHLVFATLHTNDAASAITRLCDIGIEPFLVASSLHGVLAQRLMRRLCLHCRQAKSPDSVDDAGRRLLEEAGLWGHLSLWEGRGCERCRFTGYCGRMAVGEVLVLSGAIRSLIHELVAADPVRAQAVHEGMRLLRDTALSAVAAGLTTVSEVLRVTQEEV